MLKVLVDSAGRISSHEISHQLDMTLSTAQRRRRRLEATYFKKSYSLDFKKFGYRRIELLVYTAGGTTIDVGRKLLTRTEVSSVFRTIGEHAIDLRVEVFVKDNGALLNLLEQVKAMNGVRDVTWTEILEPVEKEEPLASLNKRILIMRKRPESFPFQNMPIPTSMDAQGLERESTEELRILERISVNGQ